MLQSSRRLPPRHPRRRVGVDAAHPSYRWWVLSVTSLGMFLATVNSGTLLIALPDVERALGTSLLTLVWVILAYMVSSTVLLLTAGRLGDQFGRRRLFVAGLALFTLASLGAGFADSGTALIVWRVVQGIGGALVFANSGALVTDAFPREQLGLAMGTNVMVAAVGLVVGPVLGGWLVELGWQWVFWFNVPLGVIGTIWAALVLRELARRDTAGGYDLVGNALGLVGLTGLVLALSEAGLDGWTAPLRPDVPVRLLLPGPLGRRPDHGRDQADADGAGHARRGAAGGLVGRPPRLARGGGAGDAPLRGGDGGDVISIALMLMIVTSVVPTDLLFRIFSGLTTGLSADKLDPFMHGMHMALWVLVAFSLVGAAVSALRGRDTHEAVEADPALAGRSAH